MFEAPLNSLALAELAPRPQWVLWRYETRNGKKTKVPYSALTGGPASTTKKQTWTKYDSAIDAIVKNRDRFNLSDGLGFVFTDEDPYVGIDLDKCISDEGVIEEWALEIITALDSYTEYSPSGKGFHIYIKAQKRSDRCRTGRLEIYSTGRYFTFTGKRYEKTSEKIETRKDEFTKIFDQYLERSETNPPVEIQNLDLSQRVDPEKLQSLISNNPKFRKTWCHQRDDLKDQTMSGYDLSLANFAAHAGWTDNEIAALIILHRHTFGEEEKGQRQDYLIRQIKTARSGMRDGTTEKDLQLNESIQAAKESGNPQEALASISEALGVSVEKILKRGEHAASYYFVVGGKEILIGETEKLITIKAVKCRIFDATKKMVTSLSQKRWEKLGELFELIVEEDHEYKLTRRTEILEMIDEYITSKPPYQGDEWNAALLNLDVFEKDNQIWIHATSALKFLSVNSFFEKQINRIELLMRFREVGFKSKDFTYYDKELKTNTFCRTYWGISKDSL
jgi:hypothetical protein